MLSRFFSKSQPIVFLALSFYMLLGFIGAIVFYNYNEFNLLFILKQTGVFLLLVFLLLLINFICKRNEIDQQNAYAILFFSALSLNFPESIINYKAVMSLILVLLAMRRLLNLKNNTRHKKKIFEASFFLFLASLFYPWLIGLVLIIYLAIAFYSYHDTRNFIVPIMSFFSAYMISLVVHKIFSGHWLNIIDNFKSIDVSFQIFYNNELIFGLSGCILFTVLIIPATIKQINQDNVQKKLMLRLLSATSIVFLLLILFFVDLTGDELFIYSGIVVLPSGNFLSFKKNWINEIIIIIFLISPLISWIPHVLNL